MRVLCKPAQANERVAAEPAPIHWKIVLQALIIAAAGLWIYWPALHGGWLWDDDLLVWNNSELHTLRGLWQIWFTVPKTDYWPLTWTVLWMEWHLWGNEPFGYHICNLALHLSSGFLIWRLLNRLGLRYGWLGGLLFVVHPLAVESVAWVSEIKNTLSLPLFLLSLNAWLDTEENKSSGFLRSVFYYLAAMLAKTSTVMLPLVLLLYCWWKRGHVTRQELIRTFPFFAIAMTLGLVTVFFQNFGQLDPFSPEGFVIRLIGAGTAFFFYLGKFILPINLLPIYPGWIFDPPGLLQVLSLPALAGLLFGLWTQRWTWGRHVLFGFGFFLLNLLPVLGLVQMQWMGVGLVADHLVYLPMIGLVGVIALGLAQLPSSPHLFRVGTVSIAVMIGLLLCEKSRNYAWLFKNGETLWTYTLRHNPQAWPHYNLGFALFWSGHVPEAIEQFKEAMKIAPDSFIAHNNFGGVLLQTGHVPEAIEQFKEALRIAPDNSSAHYNLGLALLQTGQNVPEAIEQFTQALKIAPNNVSAHYNLGIALSQTGHMPEAIEQFKEALRIEPDNVIPYNNFGGVLLQTGHVAEAIEQFREALKIEPGFAPAQKNLAIAQALLNSSPADK
jgi:Tfp pilus assembly protein PilF